MVDELMPVLKDARQEKFCRLLVRGGMKQQDAHHEAGYVFNPGNASKLANKPHIKARLDELKEMASGAAMVHAAIDRSWVLIRLMRVVERCMGDTEGREDEFVPQSAIRALELLGKEQGMFVDKRLLGVRRIEDMTEEELLEFLGGEPEPSDLSAAAGDPPVGHA